MGHVPVLEEARKPIRAYMLGVEWLYEIEGLYGVSIFPGILDLYETHSLSYFKDGSNPPQDGIVEVQIRFIRHIPAEECWEEKCKLQKEYDEKLAKYQSTRDRATDGE